MGQASFGFLEVRKGSQENKGLVTGNSDRRGVEGKKKKGGGISMEVRSWLSTTKKRKGWPGLGFREIAPLDDRAEMGTWGKQAKGMGTARAGHGGCWGKSTQGALVALECQLPFTLFLSAAK